MREEFSKETVEIRKKLWDQVKKLQENGKYAVIKYDKRVILFKMHTPKGDYENLKFSPFDLQNILLNNNNDPDTNYFNANQFSDRNYFTIEKTR